jgi:vacuolar protein sorting-associated protein 3
MRDTTTAEAYCALGGELLPPKLAMSIVEGVPGLQSWKTSPLLTASRPVDDGLRKDLLKVLLEVYLTESYGIFDTIIASPVSEFVSRDSRPERAAHLLDAQATSLDVTDVGYFLNNVLAI